MIKILFSAGYVNHQDDCDFTFAIDDQKYILVINFNYQYLVATTKTKDAVEKIQNWWDVFAVNENKSIVDIENLMKIIRDLSQFDLIEIPIDAYKEYLRINNGETFLNKHSTAVSYEIFPKESFQLMIIWYNNVLDLKCKDYKVTSIDDFNQEVKNEIEYQLISELIIEINERHLGIYQNKEAGLRKVATPLGKIYPTNKRKIDLIPIKRFLKWLAQRQSELMTTKDIDVTQLIDLSDSQANEKIIFLNDLGVIEFLRKSQPFNTSVNSLATIFSAITGEKVVTLQSYLNPLINKESTSKNYPYNSKLAVQRVSEKLIKIGFKQ